MYLDSYLIVDYLPLEISARYLIKTLGDKKLDKEIDNKLKKIIATYIPLLMKRGILARIIICSLTGL